MLPPGKRASGGQVVDHLRHLHLLRFTGSWRHRTFVVPGQAITASLVEKVEPVRSPPETPDEWGEDGRPVAANPSARPDQFSGTMSQTIDPGTPTPWVRAPAPPSVATLPP